MAGVDAKESMRQFAINGDAELLTYRPVKAGLGPRPIWGLVERTGRQPLMQAQNLGVTVTALNDPELGIPADPALSDGAADRIDVPERRGGPPTTRSFRRFVRHDDDWVTIEVV